MGSTALYIEKIKQINADPPGQKKKSYKVIKDTTT